MTADFDKDVALWREEERIAQIKGWDFSHINGRYAEEGNLPWDYKKEILKRLTSDMKLLDIDTGGGEFLLALRHPAWNTSATEGYQPNVRLCFETLLPMGIDIREADAETCLPFEDESFDMVINRHGSFNESEIYRVLKKNGLFITQQVGAENDRELVEMLLPELTQLPFPKQYASQVSDSFRSAGFEIERAEECFAPIVFYDVGALVWFARIIEWEFPGFSVDACLDHLIKARKTLDETGKLEGRIHRFFLIAKKHKKGNIAFT